MSQIVCVSKEDYPASLELWKLYETMPHDEVQGRDMLRVVDESAENFLVPIMGVRNSGTPSGRRRDTASSL